MASTMVQSAIPIMGPRKQLLCVEHQDEKVSFSCKDCHRLVCDTCVEGKHKTHEFKSLKNTVRDIEKNLKKEEDKLKPLIAIYHRRGTMHLDYNVLISSIESRAHRLITNIEKVRDRMRDECLSQKEREDRYHDDYESVYHPMMQKFDEIEKLLQNSGVHNHSQICQAQLDFDDRHKIVIDRANNMNFITPKFIGGGKDDDTELGKLFGTLEFNVKNKPAVVMIQRKT